MKLVCLAVTCTHVFVILKAKLQCNIRYRLGFDKEFRIVNSSKIQVKKIIS